MTIFKLKSRTYLEGLIWPFNDHENLHIANEQDIHASSKTHEERGDRFDLGLLIILYLVARFTS